MRIGIGPVHTTVEEFMAALTAEKCVACRAGAPQVTAEEIADFQPQIPDWNVERAARHTATGTGIQVSELPPGAGVHERGRRLGGGRGTSPALLTEWGRVTVTWWTHKIRGLHRNDFIMAAKTDALYQG